MPTPSDRAPTGTTAGQPMLLVVGNAATLDLVLSTDGQPSTSAVGQLHESPGARGDWTPGGAALTVALAARAQGVPVRLWHPFAVSDRGGALQRRLEQAGVDMKGCPWVDAPPVRCVLAYGGDARLAWSRPGFDLAPPVPADLLDGITHLAIAPVWGPAMDALLQVARAGGVHLTLVGAAPPPDFRNGWDLTILDAAQDGDGTAVDAVMRVVTHGAQGASIMAADDIINVPSHPAGVIDTTGAGDTFAGTFLAAVMTGRTAEAAGSIAAEAAARACEGWGSWAAFSSSTSQAIAQAASPESRARGALWGLACGDAFGMPNSFMKAPPWRTAMETAPDNNPYHAGYPAGRITDDTEQALALTAALEDGFSLDAVAHRLNEWFVGVGGAQSLAVGPSTMRALLAYQQGQDVNAVGRFGVTNGAAMRITPVGVYAALAGLDGAELLSAVVRACVPTHHTGPAIAGAAAIAAAVAAGVAGRTWDEVLAAAERGARTGADAGYWVYAADVAARIGLGRRLAAEAADAAELAISVSTVLGAGEPSTESVPAAIAVADFAKGDPRRAIEIAGNLVGDTDTVAAMAGAVCGAYAGEEALPPAWRTLVAQVNGLDIAVWAQRLAAVDRHRTGSP